MRKVILDLAVSLDGFIEGPNGEIDWCILDDDMNFDGFLSTIDTILYGRVSYEAWGNYHPSPDAGEGEQAFWRSIHGKKKVVFTRRELKVDGVTIISDDIAKTVRQLKAQDGKDIWLYGGAGLIKSFIDLKLIDVYRMSVHPLALGSGKPLFEDMGSRLALKFIQSNVFRSGVVQLIYHSV